MTSMVLDYAQEQALRVAMWRGYTYLPGGGRSVDVDRLVEAVTEVLTPVAVVEVAARTGFDEENLNEMWSRVEARVQKRVREKVEAAIVDMEAQGFPMGDDIGAVDRALAAVLNDVHTVNDDEQEQA